MKHTHIHDQGVGRLNEDAWFANGNMFGVFDGATGIVAGGNTRNKTGGYLAANIAKNTFFDGKGMLEDLFEQANRSVSSEMDAVGVDTNDKLNLWTTSLAVVQIDGGNMKWVQTGDCLILIINTDNSWRLLVEDYNHDRETLLLWQQFAQQKVLNIREKLVDQVSRVRRAANVTYGVLNGEKEAVNFMKSGTEDAAQAKHVLLFTDGLFIPKTDVRQEDDFGTLVKLYLEGGLESIQKHVRSLEESDPNMWKYPRFKKHDDMAAIAIKL